MQYVDEQATVSAVPDDRTIVVERFRDEVGDWRVCILSPLGARVHTPWALAIEQRVQERFGPGAQVLWSDDGIVIRLPEAIERIPLEDLLFDPDAIEEAVIATLPGTALFASIFREASARALLLPRRRPGQRTPMWQQRQRSADLLSAAGRFPDFPMLLEATRECLRDHFDVPALRELMAAIAARRTRVVAVDTERASPFAQSLLFGWIAVYMYEGDAPLAERRAAALSLDRDLLRDLLGSEDLRELLDPAALDEVELELQRLAEGRRVRSPTRCTTSYAISGRWTASGSRRAPTAMATPGSAGCSRKAGRSRWRSPARTRAAAVEDAGRLRDGAGRRRARRACPRCISSPATRRSPISSPDTRARMRPSPRSTSPRGSAPTAAPSPAPSRRSAPTGASCRASFGPAGSSANGATATSCAGSGAGRSRRFAARWSRSTRRRSGGSCPRGRAPTGRAGVPTR